MKTFPEIVWWILMLLVSSLTDAECPTGCTICNGGNSNKCSACAERYRLENDVCIECPDRCLKCSSDGSCQQCESPYHGSLPPDICNKTCPPNCDGQGCGSVTEYCFGCKENYYGERCTRSCEYCKDGLCDIYSCKRGCISGYFEVKFANQYTDCWQCKNNCVECSKYTNCARCIDGYFLVNENECNDCNLIVAGCTRCNFTLERGLLCGACREGYHLEGNTCLENNCQSSCAVTCDNNNNCIGGCKPGFTGSMCTFRCNSNCYSCIFSDQNKCETCNGDFYTESCTEACSWYCSVTSGQKTCNITGICLNGCVDGYWSDKCDKRCNSSCQKCDQMTGQCMTCKNYSFGDSCEQTCSANCLYTNTSLNVCKRQTGICIQGCTAGFSGETCNISINTTTTTSSMVITTANLMMTTTLMPKSKTILSEITNADKISSIGVTAGVSATGVVVLVVTLGLYCLRKHSRKETSSSKSIYINTQTSTIQDPKATENESKRTVYETLSETNANNDYTVLSTYTGEALSRDVSKHTYCNTSGVYQL